MRRYVYPSHGCPTSESPEPYPVHLCGTCNQHYLNWTNDQGSSTQGLYPRHLPRRQEEVQSIQYPGEDVLLGRKEEAQRPEGVHQNSRQNSIGRLLPQGGGLYSVRTIPYIVPYYGVALVVECRQAPLREPGQLLRHT